MYHCKVGEKKRADRLRQIDRGGQSEEEGILKRSLSCTIHKWERQRLINAFETEEQTRK